jgi:hypothetical protein
LHVAHGNGVVGQGVEVVAHTLTHFGQHKSHPRTKALTGDVGQGNQGWSGWHWSGKFMNGTNTGANG